MKPARAAIAAVCGGLVVLAGLIWWQSTSGETSLPGTEPGQSTASEDSGETGTLEGEGRPRSGDSDIDRERLASRPVEGVPGERHGSLLLRVVYGDDDTPAARIGVVVWQASQQGPGAARRFTTDGEGSVRVADLRPGDVHVRTHRQPTKIRRATVVAGEETRLTLVLEGGIDVHGLVVDTGGAFVAGAEIILAGWAALEPHVAARSDERGRFRLRQVPERVHLGARAPGYAPSPLQTITAGAGARVEVRIVLPGPGGGVRGRVLDSDGQGVAGVLVKMGLLLRDTGVIQLAAGLRGLKPRAAETRTEAGGRFELRGLAPVKTPVLAQGEGFAPWVGSVEVVAHVMTPLVIRLEREVVLEGTVYDDQGRPAAGAEVHHGRRWEPYRRHTRSSQDGSYRLEGLPAGRILVEARDPERGVAEVELDGVPGQILHWDPRLSRGRQLEVLVLDPARNPLQGVRVMAIGPPVQGRHPWFGRGYTDEEGRCLLIGCPSGLLQVLEVSKGEYATLRRSRVDPGVGRIVLRMEHEGKPAARVVGTVLDPDGRPVADAELNLVRRGEGRSRVYNTTTEGRIDIGELRPGVYRLLVRAGGYPRYRSPERDLANGETWDAGTIRLVRGGCVRVRVVNAAEATEVAKHVFLVLWAVDGKAVASIDTRQLPLRSDPVVPGRYLLRVSGPKVVPQAIPVTVEEGRDTEVRVRIQTGVPRVFEFVLPDAGDKTYQMEVSLAGGGGFRFERRYDRVRPSLFRPRGFRVRMGLAPGHYKLEARTRQGHRGELEFEVPAAGAAAKAPKRLRVQLD